MSKALAAWFLVAVAAAGTITPPRDVVQGAVGRILAIVQEQPDGAQASRAGFIEKRRAEMRKVATDTFDFEEMARRALGRYWTPRSPQQQREFVDLFTDMLERSYIGRIESYAGERLVYMGETLDGPYATVRSRIVSPRHAETTLDYRLHLDGGHWRVFDLSVDGVSFVGTYRSEFARVIQASSYDSLVERMRKKRIAIDALSVGGGEPPAALAGDRPTPRAARPVSR